MSIATLGPAGSFSELAVKKYNKNTEIIFKRSIYLVFETLKNKEVDEAVLPIENKLQGTVAETLDKLYNSDFKIKKEIVLPVNHCIAVKVGTKGIEKIHSHTQALAQCSKFIESHYPGAEIITAGSTSEALKKVFDDKQKNSAAIGLKETALAIGLKIIDRNIEDNKNNSTRFVVIGRNDGKKTGKDKTSVVLAPKVDRSGLLYDMLYPLKENNVNLLMIESRPTGEKLGEYVFYVDIDGHKECENIKKALKSLEKITTFKILGSYPKA